MSESPSTNGRNGARDVNGRFSPGNPGGPGNPHSKRVTRLRSVLLNAISEKDLLAIISKLLDQAKSGDIVAIRELLNRIYGRPACATDPDQLRLAERRLDVQDQQLELAEERLL